MTTEKIITQKADTQGDDRPWIELWDIANSCIAWGESDIDKGKFIQIAKQYFSIKMLNSIET